MNLSRICGSFKLNKFDITREREARRSEKIMTVLSACNIVSHKKHDRQKKREMKLKLILKLQHAWNFAR